MASSYENILGGLEKMQGDYMSLSIALVSGQNVVIGLSCKEDYYV